MSSDVVLSTLGADRRALISPCSRKRIRGQTVACALALAFCGIVLDGCGPTPSPGPMAVHTENRNTPTSTRVKNHIPLPAYALLKTPLKPDCQFRHANANIVQKLNYQSDCYRQSEAIVRDRLQLLQRSVERTIRAVKVSERRD